MGIVGAWPNSMMRNVAAVFPQESREQLSEQPSESISRYFNEGPSDRNLMPNSPIIQAPSLSSGFPSGVSPVGPAFPIQVCGFSRCPFWGLFLKADHKPILYAFQHSTPSSFDVHNFAFPLIPLPHCFRVGSLASGKAPAVALWHCGTVARRCAW